MSIRDPAAPSSSDHGYDAKAPALFLRLVPSSFLSSIGSDNAAGYRV